MLVSLVGGLFVLLVKARVPHVAQISKTQIFCEFLKNDAYKHAKHGFEVILPIDLQTHGCLFHLFGKAVGIT